jgi:hypothetical protein
MQFWQARKLPTSLIKKASDSGTVNSSSDADQAFGIVRTSNAGTRNEPTSRSNSETKVWSATPVRIIASTAFLKSGRPLTALHRTTRLPRSRQWLECCQRQPPKAHRIILEPRTVRLGDGYADLTDHAHAYSWFCSFTTRHRARKLETHPMQITSSNRPPET